MAAPIGRRVARPGAKSDILDCLVLSYAHEYLKQRTALQPNADASITRQLN